MKEIGPIPRKLVWPFSAFFGLDSLEGATNDYQNEYGMSPLHVACWHGLFDVAKEIQKRFPEQIHQRRTFEHGHFTPLAAAFDGHFHDIIIWMIKIGANNYIFNVLKNPTKRNLGLINTSGYVLNYIDKDVTQCKELNLLMERRTVNGLIEIISYYKDDKKMTEGIVKILKKINLPNDNKYVYLEKMADLFGTEPWL